MPAALGGNAYDRRAWPPKRGHATGKIRKDGVWVRLWPPQWRVGAPLEALRVRLVCAGERLSFCRRNFLQARRLRVHVAPGFSLCAHWWGFLGGREGMGSWHPVILRLSNLGSLERVDSWRARLVSRHRSRAQKSPMGRAWPYPRCGRGSGYSHGWTGFTGRSVVGTRKGRPCSPPVAGPLGRRDACAGAGFGGIIGPLPPAR